MNAHTNYISKRNEFWRNNLLVSTLKVVPITIYPFLGFTRFQTMTSFQQVMGIVGIALSFDAAEYMAKNDSLRAECDLISLYKNDPETFRSELANISTSDIALENFAHCDSSNLEPFVETGDKDLDLYVARKRKLLRTQEYVLAGMLTGLGACTLFPIKGNKTGILWSVPILGFAAFKGACLYFSR
jgi:hypothetical protein